MYCFLCVADVMTHLLVAQGLRGAAGREVVEVVQRRPHLAGLVLLVGPAQAAAWLLYSVHNTTLHITEAVSQTINWEQKPDWRPRTKP